MGRIKRMINSLFPWVTCERKHLFMHTDLFCRKLKKVPLGYRCFYSKKHQIIFGLTTGFYPCPHCMNKSKRWKRRLKRHMGYSYCTLIYGTRFVVTELKNDELHFKEKGEDCSDTMRIPIDTLIFDTETKMCYPFHRW